MTCLQTALVQRGRGTRPGLLGDAARTHHSLVLIGVQSRGVCQNKRKSDVYLLWSLKLILGRKCVLRISLDLLGFMFDYSNSWKAGPHGM